MLEQKTLALTAVVTDGDRGAASEFISAQALLGQHQPFETQKWMLRACQSGFGRQHGGTQWKSPGRSEG